MAYLLSPGVLATERDESLETVGVSTTTAATVIASEWGRCEEIVSIFSETDILRKFYKPTIDPVYPEQSTYKDFFTMANFLTYGNNLKVVRLVGDAARNANATLIDGAVSNVADLIIKNDKTFESRRNSGLLEDIAFAAKYPSVLGNSLVVSMADKYAFPHWDYKTNFDYPPGDGEFSLVVIDVGQKWQTDAYQSVVEKFEGLSFTPGARRFDGSSKYYKTAINAGSQYIWAGEADLSGVLSGKQLLHTVDIDDYSVSLTANSLITGATRAVTYTPSGGSASTVTTSQYSVSVGQAGATTLYLNQLAVTASGNVTFNQTKTLTFTSVTPVAQVATVVDTTSQLDLLATVDSIVVYRKYSADATPTLIPANKYTVNVADDTITIEADYLTEACTITVLVTRTETKAVTAAPYVIDLTDYDGTANEVEVTDFVNIDIVYERRLYGIRRVLTSTEFTRDNQNNTISIDPGIITTVPSGDNVITIRLSMNPNDEDTNVYSRIALAGGVSDNDIAVLNDYGIQNVCNGFYMFRNPNSIDISLILMGQYLNPTTVNWVISNVAEVRQDCVVFISPTLNCVLDNPGKELDDVISYKHTVNYDSSYSVYDSGWKYQYDRYNDCYHWLPLNPDVAGLCARTDYTNDPWWSPAGFNRGRIANVVKLAWNPGADFGAVALSGTGVSGERDDLYQAGINPVVSFVGEGTILFGDKTGTMTPSAFSRINVRRLFIVLKKMISKVSKYFLFEFNDDQTREIFKLTVAPALRDVEARRGIEKGGWQIICDESINTDLVRNRNEFKAVFKIRPNKSINFIYLTFVATKGSSSSFSESA